MSQNLNIQQLIVLLQVTAYQVLFDLFYIL